MLFVNKFKAVRCYRMKGQFSKLVNYKQTELLAQMSAIKKHNEVKPVTCV